MKTTRHCIIALLLTWWAALLPRAAGAADRWVHLGPFGGTVDDVVVAPSTPRTLYAAAMGQVYRSDDAGGHWRLASAGLLPAVTTLAVDPSDPSIAYAGRGNVLVGGDTSLFKTVDGGATWVPLPGTAGATITAIAIDPHDPSRLLAAGFSGLFRSEDGGATWEALDLQTGPLEPLFYGVAFDPTIPGVAYAASSNEGFLKSTDGGATWTKKTGAPAQLWRMAVSPTGVLVVVPVLQNPAQVFRSLDRGETWEPLGSSFPEGLIFDFAFSPGGTLLAGTNRGVFRKDAAGPGWTRLRPNRRDEVLALAADPVTDRTFYAGLGSFSGFRGVLATRDSGATWRPVNQGLAGVPVYSAEIASSDPDVIYATLAPSGLAKSTDGGTTWQLLAPGAEDQLFYLAVDPRDENVVSGVGIYGFFMRSTNGGRTWIRRQIEDGECVFPRVLTLDPRHPDDLFVAGYKETACDRQHVDSCHTLATRDGGRAWDCLEGARSSSFFDLVVDPRRSSTLYAAAGDGVYRSTDGGETWARRSAGLPESAVLELEIAPNGTLWAAARAGLFKSGDQGRTWHRTGRDLPRNRPITELVLAPSDSKVLYAALSLEPPGVPDGADLYVSTDRGATWRPLTEDGLPTGGRGRLRVDPRDAGRLYAGTNLGLYRLDRAND
jgi:photosystem II stability/assembly factor-like uncharacterized protein